MRHGTENGEREKRAAVIGGEEGTSDPVLFFLDYFFFFPRPEENQNSFANPMAARQNPEIFLRVPMRKKKKKNHRRIKRPYYTM